MGAHVFVSHSSQDVAAARAIQKALASAGITSFIAPDDIRGAKPWAEQIADALRDCAMTIVLLSGAANESPHVAREVSIATGARKPVIPVRIEDIQPARSLQYLLELIQWVDAFPPPIEDRLPEVVARVRAALSDVADHDAAPAPAAQEVTSATLGAGPAAAGTAVNTPHTSDRMAAKIMRAGGHNRLVPAWLQVRGPMPTGFAAATTAIAVVVVVAAYLAFRDGGGPQAASPSPSASSAAATSSNPTSVVIVLPVTPTPPQSTATALPPTQAPTPTAVAPTASIPLVTPSPIPTPGLAARIAWVENDTDSSSIWWEDVPASGGTSGPTRLLKSDGIESLDAPTWSPDGRWLAFVSQSGKAISVEPVGGLHGDTQLQFDVSLDQFYDPSWSPDGRLLAFAAAPPGADTPTIYVASLPDDIGQLINATPVLHTCQLLPPDPDVLRDNSRWSAMGRLAFREYGGTLPDVVKTTLPQPCGAGTPSSFDPKLDKNRYAIDGLAWQTETTLLITALCVRNDPGDCQLFGVTVGDASSLTGLFPAQSAIQEPSVAGPLVAMVRHNHGTIGDEIAIGQADGSGDVVGVAGTQAQDGGSLSVPAIVLASP